MARAAHRSRPRSPKKPTKRSWANWRERRIAELVASGMPISLALSGARAEAKVRDKLAIILGREKALQAQILYEIKPSGFRFVLMTPDRDLEDTDRLLLEASGAQFIVRT